MILGIDIGATKIAFASFSQQGIFTNYMSFPTIPDNGEMFIGNIEDVIDEALKEYLEIYSYVNYEAVGIGVVGHIDYKNCVLLQSLNIAVPRPVDFKSLVSRHINIPVYVDNDVNAATIAEVTLGIGTVYNDFIYINIGTGIAAGIVCNGQLIRGGSNYAGEIGHTSVCEDQICNTCKQKGCLESIVSGKGIKLALKEKRNLFQTDPAEKGYSAEFLFEAAENGDPAAVELYDRVFNALETTVRNLVNILNPEAIVFGGSVTNQNKLISGIRTSVLKSVLPIASATLKHIKISELGVENVGIIGAAQLAWNGHKKQCRKEEKSI